MNCDQSLQAFLPERPCTLYSTFLPEMVGNSDALVPIHAVLILVIARGTISDVPTVGCL